MADEMNEWWMKSRPLKVYHFWTSIKATAAFGSLSVSRWSLFVGKIPKFSRKCRRYYRNEVNQDKRDNDRGQWGVNLGISTSFPGFESWPRSWMNVIGTGTMYIPLKKWMVSKFCFIAWGNTKPIIDKSLPKSSLSLSAPKKNSPPILAIIKNHFLAKLQENHRTL